MKPSEYFTFDRITSRRPEQLPKVLFHWTRSFDLGLKILADGKLIGRPTVSTSENPAFGTPGPIVFILSPEALLDRGFTLWPYLWQKGAEREAEWVIAADDAEFIDRRFGTILSSRIEVPLQGIARMVGYPASWVSRKPDQIETLRQAAQKVPVLVGPFDWEEWWQDGLVIP